MQRAGYYVGNLSSRVVNSSENALCRLPMSFLRWSSSLLSRMCSNAAQPVLNITEKCAERLRRIASANELLRILVDSGGCAGFEYKFDLVNEVNRDEDVVFERNGARVVVDKLSLQFLNGSTVDYQEELIRSSFRIIENPIAERGCSCGTSFALKGESQ
uniref:Iron-sulfur cluster assembly 2 homolog, mitochondrial n=1 Tax=Trichuris muris TaxID=70415 RepID=A0A5S6QZH0_TRIMR